MISKGMLKLVLVLLISSTLASDCYDGSQCPDKQTCCSTKDSSYACCDYPRAVCCSDKEHCCPENSSCDLEKRRCVSKGNFLTAEFSEAKPLIFRNKAIAEISNKIALRISPEQQMDLLNGFLEGSELKKYIPDMTDCAANTTSVVNAIRQAVADFSKANATFDDIADGIRMIGVAIQGLANATKSCKNLPNATFVVIDYIKRIVNDTGRWFSLVSANAAKNSIWIMYDLYSLQSLIDSSKYKDAGFKIGEVFKYIFKVDLGVKLVNLFQIQKLEKPSLDIDIGKIIKCAQTVYTVAQKAIPVVQDLVANPGHIGQALIQLYGFYTEVAGGCAGVFNTTKIETFFKKAIATNFLLREEIDYGRGAPSISDIINCVKSIKPFATDIANAVTAFTNKQLPDAWRALEQAVVDGINLGYTCYMAISGFLGSEL